MIIRSIVVLALYHSLVFASPDAGPQSWKRSSDLSTSDSPSLLITSTLPTITAQPVLLAANHSSKHHQPNATHHLLPNDTHTSTTLVRKPTITRFPLPGQTVQPGAARPFPGNHSNNPSSKGSSVAQIFFEVLGGVAGAIVLLAVFRCIYVYRKTPTNRHPPIPEVGEIDRTMALLRTTPWRPVSDRPPPPPYQPAPEYDAVIGDGNEEREPRPPDRAQVGPEPVV